MVMVLPEAAMGQCFNGYDCHVQAVACELLFCYTNSCL